MRKEPYAGSEFYGTVKKLVGMIIYVPRNIRDRYNAKAKRERVSAQKLVARVVIRNAPKR